MRFLVAISPTHAHWCMVASTLEAQHFVRINPPERVESKPVTDPPTDKRTFLFATCQVGAEQALKDEIVREHPHLRLAFSRPGFVTFKAAAAPGVDSQFVLDSVFARTYGACLGTVTADRAAVIDMAKAMTSPPLRLHLWSRDLHAPRDAPLGYVPGELSAHANQEIRALHATGLFHSDVVATLGDLVLDVIIVDEDVWWIGCHRHSPTHSPYPGARPPIPLPRNAPSRAYLKIEEGILWADAPLQSGDTAVEVGSAPGGACLALLDRGLRVVGIDPAAMHPSVLSHRAFRHIQRPMALVRREELPASVQWMVLDVNIEPGAALIGVDRLVARMRDTLLGVLFTLKLNNWQLVQQLPRFFDHVRAMGLHDVTAKQLANNGREIFVYGETAKGMARRRGP